MNPEEIERLQRSVAFHLGVLKRVMRNLILCEDKLIEIQRRIKMLNAGIRIQQNLPDDLIELVSLVSILSESTNKHMQLLRDIDQISGRIAGYISVAIEESFRTRNVEFKIWTRDQIDALDDVRHIDVDTISKRIELPVAVGILTPYLAKTRTGENSSWFASVRNAIRRLSR